jgi:hypothetical protein
LNEIPLKTVAGCLSTNNSRLASLLITMGCPVFAPQPVSKIVKDGETIVRINFAGDAETRRLILAWEGEGARKFCADPGNDASPYMWIRAAFENHSRLIDMIKQKIPLHVVERDGKTYLVPGRPRPGQPESGKAEFITLKIE